MIDVVIDHMRFLTIMSEIRIGSISFFFFFFVLLLKAQAVEVQEGSMYLHVFSFSILYHILFYKFLFYKRIRD